MISRSGRFFRNPDTLAILFLIGWPCVYFSPVILGQSVWLTTDILRLTFPFWYEFSHALDQGHLPLWTNGILAGFPLVAEGQVSALYPINFLAFRLLPAIALLSLISLSVIFHLASGACGMYLFVRSLGLRSASAVLAGLIFSFNGWVFGHLSHVGVIAAISWLPWSLYFLMRYLHSNILGASAVQVFQRTRAGIWLALIALAFAMMYLSGSVQLAFFNSLVFLAVAAADALFERRATRLLWMLASFALGLGIAAAQLVPTAELVGYSVRSGTDPSFYTSYSFPIEFLQQFVAPFFQGEPSEGTGEYWAYFAFAPLFLTLVSPFLKRDRRTIFYFLFALVALSLAFGGNNPLFLLLYRLPIFSFFRVPARFLYLFIFGGSICAAFALDALAERLTAREKFPRQAILLFVPVFLVIYLAHSQPLDFWLGAWRVLPFVLAIGSIILIAFALTRKISREFFLALVLACTFLDLALYMPPFLKTIDELTPVSAATTQPRSLAAFQSSQTPARVFTDLSVFPSVPAMRGSMFPNIGMVYGVQSAQAYASLSFGRHEAYLSQASPAMLDLLNARWFAVPLEPRPSGNRITPPDNFYLALSDESTVISTTRASAIEISSFTEHAETLADGAAVAEIEIAFSDGTLQKFPLRVGIETADWDYGREGTIAHKPAPIAHSFPAFWRSFGKTFDGHTYLARFDISSREVRAARLRLLDPNAQFHMERISLLDSTGRSQPLATLANKNNFTLAYLSDTVAIWENQDALPRAFIVHGAEVADDSSAFARMQDPAFEPRNTVILNEGRPLSRANNLQDAVEIASYGHDRLVIRTQINETGYMVLADSWYPGWSAYVDGNPAPLYRADVIFRAVPLDPGSHTVVLEYRPMSLFVGGIISFASLIATLGMAFGLRRKSKSGR